MKKVFIVISTGLLLIAILTFSACTGGIPGTANSGNGQETGREAECETICGRLCTDTRDAAMQHSSWTFFIGRGRGSGSSPGTMQVRRDQAGFTFPAPSGNEKAPGNIRPASENGQNSQQKSSQQQNSQYQPFSDRENLKNREMLGREELNRFLEKQDLNKNQNRGPNSNQNQDLNRDRNIKQEDGAYYQAYVTPDADAVENYLEENGLGDKYEIYEAALSWTWVSDDTLHGTEEKWLTPAEFLEETQEYAKNPVSGEPVSDCEEQAHTLASLLIASGEYDESSVRVAVGEVNFGEASSGHAWVEVYEEGAWLPLDATGGPYYDDGSSELLSVDVSEIDYEEYLDSPYPVVEVWYYYNNEYFLDPGIRSGDAPVSWQMLPDIYKAAFHSQTSRAFRLR